MTDYRWVWSSRLQLYFFLTGISFLEGELLKVATKVKPGFCVDFSPSTQIFRRNPVSSPSAFRTVKVGQYTNLPKNLIFPELRLKCTVRALLLGLKWTVRGSYCIGRFTTSKLAAIDQKQASHTQIQSSSAPPSPHTGTALKMPRSPRIGLLTLMP